MKVAILGGGITGTSLADLLQKKGVDYDLFEASKRLGGLCKSETVEGFVADRAGGHIIFSKNKDVLQYVLDAVEDIGTHESERKSAIYYRGDFVRYPYENGLGDLPKEDNFECLSTYIDAHFAREQGAEEPQNFRDWCDWRFGKGISRTFMHPYNEKIWKTDLEDMSIRWVSGRIPDAPVNDVIRASIGIDTEGYKHQSVFWYPLTGGFESIVTGIAKRLDQDRIHVATPVETVVQDDQGYLVNGKRYDKVISTIPLQQLAPTLGDIPAEIQTAFDGLTYTSVMSILVALDQAPDTDRSWIYFPHPENGPFNRVTHISNYSPRNAPEGKSALMAEVTYKGDIDAEACEKEVVDGLVRCGFAEADKILFTRSWKNRYAYIVYSHDLEKNLEIVRNFLSNKGIDLLGRFGDYNYFNSDQCIESVMKYVEEFK